MTHCSWDWLNASVRGLDGNEEGRRINSADSTHVAYGALVRWLRMDPDLPEHLQGMRFFEIALRLTGPSGFGKLWASTTPAPWIARRLGYGPAASELRRLSEFLWRTNVALLEEISTSERTPCAAILSASTRTALEGDEQMVIFEQHAVDRYLAGRPMPLTLQRRIDQLFRACAKPWIAQVCGVDAALSNAIARQCGDEGKTFFDLATRIAVGLDLVRHQHATPPALEKGVDGVPRRLTAPSRGRETSGTARRHSGPRRDGHRGSGWLVALSLVILQACSGEERPAGPGVPLTPPNGPSDPRVARYEGSAFQAAQGARYFVWYGCQACHVTGNRQLDLGMTRRHGTSFEAAYAFIAQGHAPELKTEGERIPTEQLWQITTYVGTLPALDVEKQRRQDVDAAGEAQASQPPRPL